MRITGGWYRDRDYFVNRGIALKDALETFLNDPPDKTGGICSLESVRHRERVNHIPQGTWLHNEYALSSKIHQFNSTAPDTLSTNSLSKRKIGGTFFVKTVPPNPLQETLTLAGIVISPQEK